MKENREDCIFLGGDFNGRIGERGIRNWEEERGVGKRNSKDKVENAERKRLMEWIEENGWEQVHEFLSQIGVQKASIVRV
ncbi:hypothetical protein GEV33_004225 [Tenebrio molitor]|uniref:Uncharacterized protein n=1 Tax=Tenebrio molitor TaxID=7067 RepID=A0A8J6HNJ8_TENMO|nr:hypothetical protein GEV33_004225 [Tenebrio molitor]